MVNEVALVLLWGLFGPGIALLYMAAGLTVAIVGGLVIGRLRPGALRRGLRLGAAGHGRAWHRDPAHLGGSASRTPGATRRTSSGRITPYLLIGIGIGALIHGYVPTELVAAIGGRSNPLAVPIVVLIAIPLYSNAAGTIPIVQALLGKGMPLGHHPRLHDGRSPPSACPSSSSCAAS